MGFERVHHSLNGMKNAYAIKPPCRMPYWSCSEGSLVDLRPTHDLRARFVVQGRHDGAGSD